MGSHTCCFDRSDFFQVSFRRVGFGSNLGCPPDKGERLDMTMFFEISLLAHVAPHPILERARHALAVCSFCVCPDTRLKPLGVFLLFVCAWPQACSPGAGRLCCCPPGLVRVAPGGLGLAVVWLLLMGLRWVLASS